MNLFCLAYCCTFSLSFFCSSTLGMQQKKTEKKAITCKKENDLVPAGRPGTPGTKGPRSRD